MLTNKQIFGLAPRSKFLLLKPIERTKNPKTSLLRALSLNSCNFKNSQYSKTRSSSYHSNASSLKNTISTKFESPTVKKKQKQMVRDNSVSQLIKQQPSQQINFDYNCNILIKKLQVLRITKEIVHPCFSVKSQSWKSKMTKKTKTLSQNIDLGWSQQSGHTEQLQLKYCFRNRLTRQAYLQNLCLQKGVQICPNKEETRPPKSNRRMTIFSLLKKKTIKG